MCCRGRWGAGVGGVCSSVACVAGACGRQVLGRCVVVLRVLQGHVRRRGVAGGATAPADHHSLRATRAYQVEGEAMVSCVHIYTRIIYMCYMYIFIICTLYMVFRQNAKNFKVRIFSWIAKS